MIKSRIEYIFFILGVFTAKFCHQLIILIPSFLRDIQLTYVILQFALLMITQTHTHTGLNNLFLCFELPLPIRKAFLSALNTREESYYHGRLNEVIFTVIPPV